MNGSELVGEFRPKLLSRRGEVTAWALTLLVVGGWLVLRLSGQRLIPAVPFLAVFFFLAALSISLGNWMDRRTVIQLEPEGIAFTNGLRRVHMLWEEIREVQVFPSRWGNKVRVIGERAYFSFRTLGEVTVQGEVKGQMGFPDGNQILERLVKAGNLKHIKRSTAGSYYARE